MKRKLLPLILLFLSQFIISCKEEETVPKIMLEKDLVFYFPFTGNTEEQISQTNFDSHGALLSEDRFNKANSALYFQDSSFMNLSVDFSTLQGSLSLWVNVDPVSSGTLAEYPIFIAGYNYSTPVPDEYNIWIKYGRIAMYHYGLLADHYSTNSIIEAGKWYHVIFRWDNAKKRLELFVNNEKVISQDYDFPKKFPEGWVAHLGKGYIRGMGNHGPVSAIYFKGKMDEIRNYSRWITDEEVNALFKM